MLTMGLLDRQHLHASGRCQEWKTHARPQAAAAHGGRQMTADVDSNWATGLEAEGCSALQEVRRKKKLLRCISAGKSCSWRLFRSRRASRCEGRTSRRSGPPSRTEGDRQAVKLSKFSQN